MLWIGKEVVVKLEKRHNLWVNVGRYVKRVKSRWLQQYLDVIKISCSICLKNMLNLGS